MWRGHGKLFSCCNLFVMIYLFERFRQVEVLLGDFRQIELITVEVLVTRVITNWY